eukprot:TRINITY_DN30531_c0_g1_i1.p1 TRINITY_DN30531_c0_g1~~TRINITY_DN30531_c0_g1_i1.p1  ORF type:complete len:379 (+),score=65.21 TRINITY_DN30531_c0_g1_i1:88-1224(+)
MASKVMLGKQATVGSDGWLGSDTLECSPRSDRTGSHGRAATTWKPSNKAPSVLGLSLGGQLGCRLSEPLDPDDPLPPERRMRENARLSDRIATRFAADVKRLDDERRALYTRFESKGFRRPDQQEITRSIKKTLDSVTISASSTLSDSPQGTGHFSYLFEDGGFKKNMQFLTANTKSGHFIESYGIQGRYDGDFMYGMRHGLGKHEFHGETYDGNWKWDQRNGWGTLTLVDGFSAQGEWLDGKLHGFATMTDANGSVVYEGEFRSGKRHGLGRQLFESGDAYDGGWRDGRLHDRGVYYFANGDKFYGMWKDGVYDGPGVFHYADGSISRRQYKDGVLQSVQDYEHHTQKFGKTLTRDRMHKHTADRDFPKDIFLLSAS